MEIESYYIGKTDRLDKYHQTVYALFSKDIYGNKVELVEGVSKMKISFTTIEDNLLIEHPIKELTNSAEIKGISFVFDVVASSIQLHKKWYLYVVLS